MSRLPLLSYNMYPSHNWWIGELEAALFERGIAVIHLPGPHSQGHIKIPSEENKKYSRQ